MRLRSVAVLGVLFLGLAQATWPQCVDPREDARELEQRFQRDLWGGWYLEIDDLTGRPWSLQGGSFTSSAEMLEAIRRNLEGGGEEAEGLGITLSKPSEDREPPLRDGLGHTNITYAQMHGGRRVLGGEVGVEPLLDVERETDHSVRASFSVSSRHRDSLSCELMATK